MYCNDTLVPRIQRFFIICACLRFFYGKTQFPTGSRVLTCRYRIPFSSCIWFVRHFVRSRIIHMSSKVSKRVQRKAIGALWVQRITNPSHADQRDHWNYDFEVTTLLLWFREGKLLRPPSIRWVTSGNMICIVSLSKAVMLRIPAMDPIF